MATGDETRRSDPDATRLQDADRPRRADRTEQIPPTEAAHSVRRRGPAEPPPTTVSEPIGPREARGRLAAGERGAGYREKQAFRFDLLQVAAFATGVYLLVSGLVALARAGFANIRLFEPHLEVGGFHTTPLLAFIAIIVGLLLLAGGAGSSVSSASLRFGGVVIGVIGAVWIVEPGAFHAFLGVHRANGIQHLIIGVLLLLASLMPPIDFRKGDR